MPLRILLISIILAASLPAQSAPGRLTPVRPSAPVLDDLKAALNLTDEQVEKLQKIQAGRLGASRQLWEDISQKQRKLNDMVNSGSSDASAVGNLMIEIHKLQKQSNPNDPSYHERAMAVLTPEQRTKLKTLEDAVRLRSAIDQAVGMNLLVPETIPARR